MQFRYFTRNLLVRCSELACEWAYIHTYIHTQPTVGACGDLARYGRLCCLCSDVGPHPFLMRERERDAYRELKGKGLGGMGCFLVRLYLVSLNCCKDTIL